MATTKVQQDERDERILQEEWLKVERTRRDAARADLAARPSVR